MCLKKCSRKFAQPTVQTVQHSIEKQQRETAELTSNAQSLTSIKIQYLREKEGGKKNNFWKQKQNRGEEGSTSGPTVIFKFLQRKDHRST